MAYPPARAVVLARIDRLRHGLRGDWKLVGSGIAELRLHYGPGIRIYFGESGGRIVIVLAGTKRSQRRDLAKARRLWREYREDEHRQEHHD